MSFTYTQRIKFRHCDPAGIVFYPRFFEMMNDTVEAFFARRLDFPFAEVMDGHGVPTAQISAVFAAPSRLGDVLEIALDPGRVGRSSLDLDYTAHCKSELRFTGSSTLVFVDAAGRPTPWPDRVRRILMAEIGGDDR